jgi:DNA-binding transcriptional LysR family regulator
MNVHHLELFYYVARHRGIAGAVRAIPYGIQQPAVSAQIARLEDSLGVKLFQRRPFVLTPAGEELFAFVEPFFGELAAVEKKLRAVARPQLRIAAPSIVLNDYMPGILDRVRAKFPAFRLHLHEAARIEAERLLAAQEIDFAITILEGKPRASVRARSLVRLPLVLLAPKSSRITDAAQLWRQDKIEETLITFPPSDTVQVLFQRELQKRKVEWFAGVEVNSSRLIARYVAAGHGIGLAVASPGFKPGPGTRALPLAGFAPVDIGIVWSGNLSPVAQQFLAEVEAEARVVNASPVAESPLEKAL